MTRKALLRFIQIASLFFPFFICAEKESSTPYTNQAKLGEHLYELGRKYYEEKEYDKSIAAYRRSLEIQPSNSDAHVGLGYALLIRNASREDLLEAKSEFQKALEIYPDYTDAKNGIERIDILLAQEVQTKNPTKEAQEYYDLGQEQAKRKNWNKAIEWYRHSLELQPNNPDAKVGLGYALIFNSPSHKDLIEAKQLFEEVLKEHPEYADAKEGLIRIETLLSPPPPIVKTKEVEEPTPPDQILLEKANRLIKEDQISGAIEIYYSLLAEHPDNPELYFLLGKGYSALELPQKAVKAFEQAIALKPDYSDALVALGNQLFILKNFIRAREVFDQAISLDSKNSDALFGLARTQAQLGYYRHADRLYYLALQLNSESVEIRHSYAAFLLEQKSYRASESLFRSVVFLEKDNKKYRSTLFDLSSHTRPSGFASGGWGKEMEKDQISGRWVASIRYIYGEGGFAYPVNDRVRLTTKVNYWNTKQVYLLSGITQFNAQSVGASLKGEWFYNPYWTVVANLMVEWIWNAQNKNSLLPVKKNILFEPTLTFRYERDGHLVSFGELADSWIYRNFCDLDTLVFERNAGYLLYQYTLNPTTKIGASSTWIWYQDPIHNQEQDILAWLETSLPCFLKEILYPGYLCEYRQFKKITSAYYSFDYQLTHWLQIRLTKNWLSGARIEAKYWHGWRTTKGRNPQQQIVVIPNVLAPITTIHYQINQAFLTLGYTPSTRFDISLTGAYYKDSFDYTTYGAKLAMEWRF